MPFLPNYKDCEFSLFISYAFSDNQPYEWVENIKSLINDHLNAKISSAYKPVFLSGKNTFSSGDINEGLENKLKQSFAMLMVIGEGYANSKWCEEELKLFNQIFGKEGFKSRLFIVVKSKKALDDLKNGDSWKTFIDLKNLFYLEMWNKENPNEGIQPRVDKNYDADFEKYIWSISENLINKIKISESIKESTIIGSAQEKPIISGASLKIGIAPVAAELESVVDDLKAKLIAESNQCTFVDKSLIDRYNPNHESSRDLLKAVLQELDVLVVPFQESTPFAQLIPGGHLAILQQEWKAIGKSRDVVWFKPALGNSPDDSVWDEHLKFYRRLSPIYDSAETLIANLFSGASAAEDGIRIRIQNHPEVKVFDLLRKQIREVWKEIKKEASQKDIIMPELDFKPLDIKHLNAGQNDSFGYVVVKPVFVKSENSLKAQVNKIEKALARGPDFNGRVALVYREEDNVSEPEIDWLVIQCKQIGGNAWNPDNIEFNETDRREIRQFLKTVWDDYNESRPVPAMGFQA